MHYARSANAYVRNVPGCEMTGFKQEPVGNHYTIGEEIGSGRFATVKKCKNNTTEIEFAAKFIQKRRSKTSRRGAPLDIIKREVAILQEAKHQNVVKLFEVYETPQDVVLVLELISGGELFNYLSEKEKVSEDEAVIFLKQILEGVEHLHSLSIVHLDLKPENLVLDGRMRNTQLKIIDFGLSRKLEANRECRDIIGTPEFVAPEVINYDPLSTATDMWSIGVITYIMLSGCSPFLGNDKQETLANASLCNYVFDESFSNTSDLAKDFIQKLLIREPENRATAAASLNHSWIKPVNEKQSYSRRTSVLNVENLKSFVARKRWKQSFHLVCLMNHIARQVALKSGSASRESSPALSVANSQDDLDGNTDDHNSDDDLLNEPEKAENDALS